MSSWKGKDQARRRYQVSGSSSESGRIQVQREFRSFGKTDSGQDSSIILCSRLPELFLYYYLSQGGAN